MLDENTLCHYNQSDVFSAYIAFLHLFIRSSDAVFEENTVLPQRAACEKRRCSDHENDISAEKDFQSQSARISQENEHGRRKKSSGSQTCQGQKSTVCLMQKPQYEGPHIFVRMTVRA